MSGGVSGRDRKQPGRSRESILEPLLFNYKQKANEVQLAKSGADYSLNPRLRRQKCRFHLTPARIFNIVDSLGIPTPNVETQNFASLR